MRAVYARRRGLPGHQGRNERPVGIVADEAFQNKDAAMAFGHFSFRSGALRGASMAMGLAALCAGSSSASACDGLGCVGSAVESGVRATGHAVEKGARTTGHVVERGARATTRGVEKGAVATGHAVDRGVRAVGEGVQDTGKALTGQQP